MDDRAWQLIKLLNDKNYTTAAQLAEQIGVSGKTIRNRLKLLSEELEMHGAELESCTGYGYRLHIVDSQKYKAWKAGQTELLWSEHLPESTSERVAFLLELLLQTDNYIKLDDLCEKLYVSRNTLGTDIREIREILQSCHLRLTSRPGYGIRVEGSEFERRNLMARRMMLHSRLSAQNLLPEPLRRPLVEEVSAVMKANHLRMQDDAFEELLLYIVMMIQRISDGHEITMTNPERLRDVKASCSSMDAEANDLADALELRFGIRCNALERTALAVHLVGKAQPYSQRTTAMTAVQLHLNQLLDLMLEKICTANGLDLTKDQELREALLQHLGPMNVRIKYNIPLENPLLPEIRREYPLAFTLAGSACSVLQEYYQKTIPEDEIGYIAVLLALSLEKTKHAVKKKNIVVVCATGRSSAKLFLYRYKQLFGEFIDQMYDCASFELEEFDFKVKQIDCVFTTVPLSMQLPVPVFQVSLLLEADEIENCQKMLQSESTTFLCSYFRPELFIPHLKAETRDQALQEMCELACQHFDLPQAFYRSVLEREEMAPTDFGNYTAIPHSLQIMSDRKFVVAAVLDKPIWWGHNTVQVIFLISLTADDTDLERFYQVIYRFISNPGLVQALVSDPEYKNLIALLGTGA